MVSDPEIFGQVAATNALSDVYAMGGVPVCALNITAFPEAGNFEILEKILTGGAKKVGEANAALVGGHTISDQQPKYGLSVMGTVHPKKIWTNCGTQTGDILFLTKPLGIGIIVSAYNVGEMDKSSFYEAVKLMTTLNKYAAEVLHKLERIKGFGSIHACTDVTGFGFLGHLAEMVGNEKTARIDSKKVPYIKSSYNAAKEFLVTGGGQKNRNFLGERLYFGFSDYALEEILLDPQTSGGLIFSVAPENGDLVMQLFENAKLPVWNVGYIEKYCGRSIIVD